MGGLKTRGKQKPHLSRREIIFVREYVRDANGARAARKAGYSAPSASQRAHQLLQELHIKKALAGKLKALEAKSLRSSEWVLDRLEHLAKLCSNERSKYYKPSQAHKSLELLGKFHKLWTDNVEIISRRDLGEEITAARKRQKITVKETTTSEDAEIVKEFTLEESS